MVSIDGGGELPGEDIGDFVVETDAVADFPGIALGVKTRRQVQQMPQKLTRHDGGQFEFEAAQMQQLQALQQPAQARWSGASPAAMGGANPASVGLGVVNKHLGKHRHRQAWDHQEHAGQQAVQQGGAGIT